MNKKLHRCLAAAAAAFIVTVAPAHALTDANLACSQTDIIPMATTCLGSFVGNINNAANYASVASAIEGAGWGHIAGGIVEQLNLSEGSDLSFSSTVQGFTIIGVHWGGGKGGGNSALYLFDLGAGDLPFSVADINPMLGKGGVSNVALYSTSLAPVSPVPESQTAALMLAGLAGMGFVARRRRPA